MSLQMFVSLSQAHSQEAFNCFFIKFHAFFSAFYTILSPSEVLGSEAVAVTFANKAFGLFAWTIPRKPTLYFLRDRFLNPFHARVSV